MLPSAPVDSTPGPTKIVGLGHLRAARRLTGVFPRETPKDSSLNDPRVGRTANIAVLVFGGLMLVLVVLALVGAIWG